MLKREITFFPALALSCEYCSIALTYAREIRAGGGQSLRKQGLTGASRPDINRERRAT